MGVLDPVVNEVGSEFGLTTGSTGSLLSGLLSVMNQDGVGVSGLLDRFRRAGVANVVSSWLSGDAQAVSTLAVENALGHDTVATLASRAGLSFSTALSAIAFMIPKLIQRLTPGGAVPTRLSTDFAPYISTALAGTAHGAGPAMAGSDAAIGRAAGNSSYLWLVPLIAAGIVALWFMNRGSISGAFDVQRETRMASQRATAALSSVRPGFTAPDLANALNRGVIAFPIGSAELPAESRDFLNRAAARLRTASGMRFEVGGHTDNTGNPSANLTLSEQRASAVRDYLVQQGVPSEMLTVKGYGDTRPVAPNNSDDGRFRNRRIEFSVK